MANQLFKAGNVVRLKSGGPKMTVVKYGTYSGQELCLCKWFDEKNKLAEDTFTEAELEGANAKDGVGIVSLRRS